jgi:16S rRNA (guanine1207-N2)-methyltransferase
MDHPPGEQNDHMSSETEADSASHRAPAVELMAEQLVARTIESGLSPSDQPVHLLASTISRGQGVAALRNRFAVDQLSITIHEFEHYRLQILRHSLANVPDIHLHCAADPPQDQKVAIAMLTVRRDWGAELTRELIQSFAFLADQSGYLIVIVDHPDDRWIGDILRQLSKQVKRFTQSPGATGYVVSRSQLKLRQRDYTSQFAFRHGGRLIQALSRPGVFAHRKLDLGARRLIDAMTIKPGQRVIDIGCGSGTVSFAAALSADGVRVVAIDSNTRAIESTARGAELNGIGQRIEPILTSDGTGIAAGEFDVALGNPPYFANFQIAELFLQIAHRALVPGGQVWMVAKQPDWYKANVPRWFDRVNVTSVGNGYCIATGVRPARNGSDGPEGSDGSDGSGGPDSLREDNA